MLYASFILHLLRLRLLLLLAVSSPRAASKTTPRDGSLHHLAALHLQFGYPVDAFGGLFPTFAVKAEGWHGDLCVARPGTYHRVSRRCQLAIEALYGVYGAREYSEIMQNKSYWPYEVGRMRLPDERTTQAWTRNLFKATKFYLPVYLQHDITPERQYSRVSGLITTERLNKIRQIMQHCVKRLTSPLPPGEMLEWACGYAQFLAIMRKSEENMPHGSVKVTPQTDSRTMSALFWLLFCTHAWRKVIRMEGEFNFSTYHPSCPNVCARYHGNPCLGKPNVVQLPSAMVEGAPAHHDRVYGAQICRNIDDDVGGEGGLSDGYAALSDQAYQCVCRKGYTWSKETKSCALEDGCSGNSSCHPKGTQMCVSSVVNLAKTSTLPFLCLCFPGYMGPRCEKRRDACIENENPSQLPGNQACRVYLGNRCEPQLGTNIYTCRCGSIYASDGLVGFPNCYRQKPVCAGVICRRGECVSSRDQLNYVCVCQMGWRGQHCDIPDIRMWLPWEGWSSCSAQVCTGLGWRHRLRHCRTNLTLLLARGVDKGLCDGEDVQRQICKAACPNNLLPYVIFMKMVLATSLGCVILLVAVGLVFVKARTETA